MLSKDYFVDNSKTRDRPFPGRKQPPLFQNTNAQPKKLERLTNHKQTHTHFLITKTAAQNIANLLKYKIQILTLLLGMTLLLRKEKKF